MIISSYPLFEKSNTLKRIKDSMSFAKDNWEEFEKLSISILKTYLPTDSEISYSITHTPNRKDGGYASFVQGTHQSSISVKSIFSLDSICPKSSSRASGSFLSDGSSI